MIGSTPPTQLPLYRPRQLAQAPPCQAACAANGDVRGWIGIVAQRRRTGLGRDQAYALAWERLAERSPFPATLGRVCPHPCESGCNRVTKDSPIAINALERFLGDWAIEHDLKPPIVDAAPSGATVAVIGAGPAGLSCAYQLARRGHEVVVHDRHPLPGGMLRYGIPDHRLPPHVLDAEIRRIAALGVRIECDVDIGGEITIEALRSHHDAVFIAAGASTAVPLGVPGEHAGAVMTGIGYLEAANQGAVPDLGDRVVVIGGGNTAVDAARVARRVGAHVEIHYRRTRAEMPAFDDEVDAAIAEGVVLRELSAPVEMVSDEHGDVMGISVQKMALGAPDAGGRRRPVPVDDTSREIPVTGIIIAVSQRPSLENLLDGAPPASDRPVELSAGLWLGGDAVGPAIAASAIRHGRLVAEAIHADLTDEPRPAVEEWDPVPATAIDFDTLPSSERCSGERVTVEAALAEVGLEVEMGIGESAFLDEVERCFSCGLCHGCGRCQMFCTVGAFTPVAEPRQGTYFRLDLTNCTSCGKCIEVCPCGYLTTTEALVTSAIGSN